MKKIIVFVVFIPMMVFSQRYQSPKFSFDIASGVYTNFRQWKENGVTGGYQISYNTDGMVYSANVIVGFGISKNINNYNGYFQAFLESDALIGREIHLGNELLFIPQVGLGYLHYTNHFQGEKMNLIGVPVQFKITFFKKSRLTPALIPRVIFNRVQNNYSLLFALNFK